MNQKVLSANRIRKRYFQSSFTLELPNLTLKEGSITGVVGENGNGKTTLLQVLAGELEAEGDFGYFGESPRPANVVDWIGVKKGMAFIPQRIPRWYGSLWENLSVKAALSGVPSNQIDQELEGLLEFLGLSQYKAYKWSEISTGFRLRFELARMLIGKPNLLILDEPLANLDLNTQERFLTDLKNILAQRNHQTAILLSSQQLHELEAVADQMIVIKNGKQVNLETEPPLGKSVLEIKTQEAERLKEYLQEKHIEFTENGSHLTCYLNTEGTDDFLRELLTEKHKITYFRDITHSAKRHL